MQDRHLLATGLLVLAAASGVRAEDDPLKPYLPDIGPGPIAANEIIGVASSLVTNLLTPKDLVAAVSAGSGDAAKEGFGIAISPARLQSGPLAVSLKAYRDPRNHLQRLWGGTTFSYARNRRMLGEVEHGQDAFAVNVTYFLKAQDDPVVAVHDAVQGCDTARASSEAFATAVLERARKKREETGRTLTGEEQEEIRREVLADQAGPITFLRRAGEDVKACARAAYDTATKKWNASRVGVTLGQGWIKAPGGSRLSLGRHAAIAAAYGTDRMPNSLFNLTLRRVTRELDTDTIATTPAYKASTFAAARYTYGWGDDQTAYAIAEISNARETAATQANAAFRQAVGVDYRLAEGIWLEFRWGRSRVVDGSGMENRALLNLKLSPAATIPKLIGG